MKIIIVGAGSVGLAVAEEASHTNDVLVIERDAEIAETAKGLLPVSILVMDGSNPVVLKRAIEDFDADILFSTVPEDGINLFICNIAKSIRPEIKTVASLRSEDYKIIKTEDVDRIISAHSISTDRITRCAVIENVISFLPIKVKKLCIATFRINADSDIVGKTVMSLPIPDDCVVINIIRTDETILETSTAEIRAGDRVGVLGTLKSVEAFNRLVGTRKEFREFAVLGAKPLARNVAKAIYDQPGNQIIRIVGVEREDCELAARQIKGAIVVNGSIIDPVFLKSEGVDRSDVVICLSDSDERNLLASMTSMRFGTRKIITRYSTDEYEPIFKYAGIEGIIGYHRLIINEVSSILADFRGQSGEGVITLDDPRDHFFGLRVDADSPLCGKYLGDVVLPAGMSIPALIRRGEIVFTRLSTRFEMNDLMLVCTHEINNYELASALGKRAPELRR